jgi:hypothetical protein
MAWNPTPEVAAAREFGRMFDKQIVIILHVNEKGLPGYVSYGRTKQLCDTAQQLADDALAGMTGEEKAPSG